MKSVSGKELAKVLEQNGWILLRIQGSHHIYGKPGVPERLSVPIHGNKSLKVGLLRHLLKVAELSEDLSPKSGTFEDSTENSTKDSTDETPNNKTDGEKTDGENQST
jgi:predicted RNA binding protein YcfA (HicA-like mRNA interferase family)